MDHRERSRVFFVGQRFANRHVRHAGNGDDLARTSLYCIYTFQAFRDVKLGDLRSYYNAVHTAMRDDLVLANRSLVDPANRQATHVRRGIEVRDLYLQGVLVVVLGCDDVGQQQFEKRLQVGAGLVGVERGGTFPGVGVHNREVDLVFSSIEVDEQFVNLVHDLCDPGIRAVDLVDDQDH